MGSRIRLTCETDRGPLSGVGRGHEFVEQGVNLLDVGLVGSGPVRKAALEFVDAAGEVLVRGDHLPHANECPHDQDADLNGPGGVNEVCGHDGPVFGEGPGDHGRESEVSKVVTICYHLVTLRPCELETEILRESLGVSFDRLVQGYEVHHVIKAMKEDPRWLGEGAGI